MNQNFTWMSLQNGGLNPEKMNHLLNSKGKQKIDLDEETNFKSMLLDKLKNGKFVYEFLPEDEIIKENYSIWNGHVSNQHSKKLTNSRLMINF